MTWVASYGPGGPQVGRFGPWGVGRDRLAPPDAKERARARRYVTRTDPPVTVVFDPDGFRRLSVGVPECRFRFGGYVLPGFPSLQVHFERTLRVILPGVAKRAEFAAPNLTRGFLRNYP